MSIPTREAIPVEAGELLSDVADGETSVEAAQEVELVVVVWKPEEAPVPIG